MQSFLIKRKSDIANAGIGSYLNGLDYETPYVVTVKPYEEKRKGKQNRLSFLWYTERGEQSGNGKEYERNYCKLHFGVMILRRDDEEFNKFYSAALLNLSYEEKIEAMEYVPVTSLMSVKQFAEYLTGIDQNSVLEGYSLSHPEDMYFEALMKEAA